MTTIEAKYLDEVYLRIKSDDGIARELSNLFTFMVPNYQHMPAYKYGPWDGKIRLFNQKERKLYIGLLPQLREYAKKQNYKLIQDPQFDHTEFSLKEAEDFIASLNLKFQPRDYQIDAFVRMIRERHGLYLCPTASGKSLIIYLLTQYLPGKKLIICPRINLVTQMAKDFIDYDLDQKVGKTIQMIKEGATRDIRKDIVITTYHSIVNQPQKWFDQFTAVIGDEAHTFKADSLKKIIHKTTKPKYKIGVTGTLDGTLTNEMVLRGMFGPITVVKKMHELMEAGYVAPLKIKCVVLSYPDEIREACYKAKKAKPSQFEYQDEIRFLLNYKRRNNYIKNLALSLKGNTLVLFTRIEEHGIPLHDAVKKEAKIPVHLVHGKIKGDDREDIRQIVIAGNESIILASTGVFSEGVNIPNIHNIIFANPSKARIKIMQSIGRGLRLDDSKTHCTLFDIADDLSWKAKRAKTTWYNYAMDHYTQRVDMYIKEKFEYKQFLVGIK